MGTDAPNVEIRAMSSAALLKVLRMNMVSLSTYEADPNTWGLL